MPTPRIPPHVFRFLTELDGNNERSWFEEHKERYLRDVRDPLLAFIAALDAPLTKISPYVVVDPRPVGGSLIRIYRDVRFSKDKRPYKTWAAMRFPHLEGREVPAPGYYLHLEPGRIFMAGGMWHAESQALGRIRDAIVDDPTGWKKASRGRGFELDEGDRLKRAPRGYDPEHPLVEDLKLKGFTTSTSFTRKEVCAPDFSRRFARACKRASPLMEFLSGAVGVPW